MAKKLLDSKAGAAALKQKAAENPDLKEAYAKKITVLKNRAANGLARETVENDLERARKVFTELEKMYQENAQGEFIYLLLSQCW